MGDQQRQGVEIWKNGNAFKTLYFGHVSGGDDNDRKGGSAIVSANGTTDYFELYAYQNTAGNVTIGLGAAQTYFQGEFIGTP